MANVYWTGATDGVVTTAGNYAGGVAPVGGDSVYALVNPVNAMASGTFPALANFVVTAGYGNNNIGSAASSIGFGNITAEMRIGCRGNVFCTSSGTVAKAAFEMPSTFMATIAGGTWTDLRATSCRIEAGAATVLTTIRSNGATGNVATNATDITAFYGSGVWTMNSRDIDNAYVSSGGRLIIKGTSTIDAMVRIERGGIFNHQSSGTVAEADVLPGGTYTVEGNTSQTATATLVRVWNGAAFVDTVPGFTLTTTTKDTVGGSTAPAIGSDS